MNFAQCATLYPCVCMAVKKALNASTNSLFKGRAWCYKGLSR